MKSLLFRQAGLRGALRRLQPELITQALARAMSTYYLESHEYLTVDGNVGTVGITNIAATALGDVVFIELPAVGAIFKANQPFGSIESVKAASDLYCPVAGEVIEVNMDLEATPTIVNQSPFEKGWLIKLKVDDETLAKIDSMCENGELLDKELYDKHTAVPYYT